MADGVDATSVWGTDVDLPSPGGGDGGSRTTWYQNLRHPSPKHCHAIYWDKYNYGPVSGCGVAYGGAGFEAVVGAGEPWSGGDT